MLTRTLLLLATLLLAGCELLDAPKWIPNWLHPGPGQQQGMMK